MEEKDMRELSMEDMDKVSGGADPLETLSGIMNQAGLAPAVYSLPQKESIKVMCDYLDQNGLSHLKIYAPILYHMS